MELTTSQVRCIWLNLFAASVYQAALLIKKIGMDRYKLKLSSQLFN